MRGIGASTSASSRPSSRSALNTRATASSVASSSVTQSDPTVTRDRRLRDVGAVVQHDLRHRGEQAHRERELRRAALEHEVRAHEQAHGAREGHGLARSAQHLELQQLVAQLLGARRARASRSRA